MDEKLSRCRGCLLGLAVGDAMGFTVDASTWEEIRRDYGPNGLLGYDLVNGTAEVSSHTQIAAYAANGLILAINRGKPELYAKYIALAMKEWAVKQNLPRDPSRFYCWTAQIPQLRRRHCRDSRMLDALRLQTLGTPEKPVNRNTTPGSLTAAAMVGAAFDPSRMEPAMVGELGARAVAVSHGSQEAFLSGAVLAYCIAGILQEPERSLEEQFLHAIEAVLTQFGEQYDYAGTLAARLKLVIAMADPKTDPRLGIGKLECDTASDCLAGAMYACLMCGEDFDSAMIVAINHSGKSAAVGALTGAILGAKLGIEALPEFYLESLDVVQVLEQLAADLYQGSPTSGLFDDDWDLKYTHGTPVGDLGAKD